jgi:5-methylcytosine-specific restriction enzyme A
MIGKIRELLTKGKVPKGSKRSSHWPKLRKEHLEKYPTCALCGGTKKLEVHHIKPFHLHPELELDPNNFITLCESTKHGVNCHLFFGHLGNFKQVNEDVPQGAQEYLGRMTRAREALKKAA